MPKLIDVSDEGEVAAKDADNSNDAASDKDVEKEIIDIFDENSTMDKLMDEKMAPTKDGAVNAEDGDKKQGDGNATNEKEGGDKSDQENEAKVKEAKIDESKEAERDKPSDDKKESAEKNGDKSDDSKDAKADSTKNEINETAKQEGDKTEQKTEEKKAAKTPDDKVKKQPVNKKTPASNNGKKRSAAKKASSKITEIIDLEDESDGEASTSEEPPTKKKKKKTSAAAQHGHDQFIKVTLKLPPPPQKIGLILQDDKKHYGIPLLMALSPDSPFHTAIPPNLVQKYWIIGIRDQELGEAKILNSKVLQAELAKRRKKNESTLVEITFAKKDVPVKIRTPPPATAKKQTSSKKQEKERQEEILVNELRKQQEMQQQYQQQQQQQQQQLMMQLAQQQHLQQQYAQQMMMQQMMAYQQQQQQAQLQQQLPNPSKVSRKSPKKPQAAPPTPTHTVSFSDKPPITSKLSKDEMIRKALSEYFVEGESRPLKQFCDEYSKLYSDISNILNEDAGLCEIQEMRDGRKVDEGFTQEESVTAMDHINTIFSGSYSKSGKKKNDDSTTKGYMPPMQIKGTCKGIQSKVVQDYTAMKDYNKDYLCDNLGLTYFQGWRSSNCTFIAQLDAKKRCQKCSSITSSITRKNHPVLFQPIETTRKACWV